MKKTLIGAVALVLMTACGGKQQTAEPADAECLACHGGTYAKLAESTRNLTPNPHDSHMADVQCSACHRWKGASRLMCSDCHSFPELQKRLETR